MVKVYMYPCTLSMHTHIPAVSHIHIHTHTHIYVCIYTGIHIMDMTMYVKMDICVRTFFPEFVHILNNNIKKKGS